MTLDVTFPESDSLQAGCDVELEEVHAGAIWMSLTCPEPLWHSRPLPSCIVRGGALFENCAH